MFTGLVRTQGTIRRVDMRGDCLMTIAMREPFAIAIGDSICCDGICLTAIKVEETTFKVSLSAETLGCTTAKDWAVGTEINLEPSLRVGDHLGGHFVSGHVDATARAVAQEQSGDSTIWEFEVPPELARFIAPKGSVTVNGVSLTVNAVKERPEARGQRPEIEIPSIKQPAEEQVTSSLTSDLWPLASSFSVNIIPHTAKETGFGRLKLGDVVNLEIYMLARYVARIAETKSL